LEVWVGINSWRNPFCYGLVVLYIAVFPANLYQAVNNIEVALPHNPPLIWLRPFQALLVALLGGLQELV